MKRVKPVRTAAVVVRVFPEERDILRLNAVPQGMSMSEIRRIVVSLSSVYTLSGWIQSVRKNAVG